MIFVSSLYDDIRNNGTDDMRMWTNLYRKNEKVEDSYEPGDGRRSSCTGDKRFSG